MKINHCLRTQIGFFGSLPLPSGRGGACHTRTDSILSQILTPVVKDIVPRIPWFNKPITRLISIVVFAV